VACKAENKTPPGVSYTAIFVAVTGNQPDEKPFFMTKPCFHCENPLCVDVYLVGATLKRETDGFVVVYHDNLPVGLHCFRVGFRSRLAPLSATPLSRRNPEKDKVILSTLAKLTGEFLAGSQTFSGHMAAIYDFASR
jgi:hypothetical protein